MGKKKPYDYKANWLSATANAYIDLGVGSVLDGTIELEIDYLSFSSNAATDACFGAHGFALHPYWWGQQVRGYVVNTGYEWTFSSINHVRTTTTTGLHISYNLNTDKEEIRNTNTGIKIRNTGNFYLFAFNNYGYVIYPTKYMDGNRVRFIRIKLADAEGKIYADFIPVVKDGVGYMYNKITNELKGKSGGSGSITFG